MVNGKIKIFLDTGSIEEIKAFHKKIIKGFTSNPTLLKNIIQIILLYLQKSFFFNKNLFLLKLLN